VTAEELPAWILRDDDEVQRELVCGIVTDLGQAFMLKCYGSKMLTLDHFDVCTSIIIYLMLQVWLCKEAVLMYKKCLWFQSFQGILDAVLCTST